MILSIKIRYNICISDNRIYILKSNVLNFSLSLSLTKKETQIEIEIERFA